MAEGAYEVWVDDLLTAAGLLGEDATAMGAAGEDGAGAAQDAAAASSGGLAAALGGFAEELRLSATGMAWVIETAGHTATMNAGQHTQNDAGAAQKLNGLDF